MARGGRRQYSRDASGRFSSSGTTRAARPPAQRVKRGTNRLTRNNAGRITGTGDGATARGGRLRTASGKLRATQTARIKGQRAGTMAKPKGLKPGAMEARVKAKAGGRAGLTGKGRAPASKTPAATSDYYKYNKAGQIATPQERLRMRGKDRAREKNTALADVQRAGALRAERKAARQMTSDRTEPLSVARYSPKYYAADNAMTRRAKRADTNFTEGISIERSKNALTAKAIKMQNQAKERKAQGKAITKTMETNFQSIRRQIAKAEKSLSVRRKALDVVGNAKKRMEINTRNRYR